MNRKIYLARVAAVAAGICITGLASPTIREGSVSMTQAGDRQVSIRYTLDDEPAIVTVDILTNDVSIGYANIQNIAGDVNVKVATGSHEILWRPDKSWPGHVFTNGEVKAVVRAWATNAPPDYMVVDLTMNNTMFFYPAAEAIPHGGVTNMLYKTSMLVMRRIPAANVRWRMGSPGNEPGRTAASETCHYVTLTEDYYMGIYEVTQKQFWWMCGTIPDSQYNAAPVGDAIPVCGYSLIQYCGAGAASSYSWPNGENPTHVSSTCLLGQLRTKTGMEFHLPTDAQWEYAYRAGCRAMFHNGSDVEPSSGAEVCEDYAWVNVNNSFNTTQQKREVGTFAPNAWGLYDMAGNVWEWMRDRYSPNASVPSAEGSEVIDPVGDTDSANGVIRSGSWSNPWRDARAARRETYSLSGRAHTIGFRLVCPAGIQ